MEKADISYRESRDVKVVLDLSLSDPETPFPVAHYPDGGADQRWFIISLAEKSIGYFSTVQPKELEIYQFFICPDARRSGVGTAAARLIVRELLAEHEVISLSAVDEVSYRFWRRALQGFAWTEKGDIFSISRSLITSSFNSNL